MVMWVVVLHLKEPLLVPSESRVLSDWLSYPSLVSSGQSEKEEAPAHVRRIGLLLWQMPWNQTFFLLSSPTPSFVCSCCVSLGS